MDITCSHCREPWEVYGLRHDSIGYLDDHQGDKLAPLGSVEDVLRKLETGGTSDQAVRAALTASPHLPPQPTLTDLFDFWWSGVADPDEPDMQAAKRVVQTAIHQAVLSGKGCPYCGFDHTGRGKHRDTTLHELVFDGVDDGDPAEYLDV